METLKQAGIERFKLEATELEKIQTTSEVIPELKVIKNNNKPEFIYYLDNKSLEVSNLRFAIKFVFDRNSYDRYFYKTIETSIIPVEGKANMYTVKPKTELPKGLCALIFSREDDKESFNPKEGYAWQFTIE